MRTDYSYKLDQLHKMLDRELSEPIEQQYGVNLHHWAGGSAPINIDAGAIKALIRYYNQKQKKELEKELKEV